jgi:hypothetical protein
MYTLQEGEALSNTISSVYSIDYEVMDHCLMHPSREVLQKAEKCIKDFPSL